MFCAIYNFCRKLRNEITSLQFPCVWNVRNLPGLSTFLSWYAKSLETIWRAVDSLLNKPFQFAVHMLYFDCSFFKLHQSIWITSTYPQLNKYYYVNSAQNYPYFYPVLTIIARMYSLDFYILKHLFLMAPKFKLMYRRKKWVCMLKKRKKS